MRVDELLRLKDVFRANQDELRVEPVHAVGKGPHPELIVQLGDGTFITEGTYNLHATRREAVAALRESINNSVEFYRKRLAEFEAALERLTDDADDEDESHDLGDPVAATPLVDVPDYERCGQQFEDAPPVLS